MRNVQRQTSAGARYASRMFEHHAFALMLISALLSNAQAQSSNITTCSDLENISSNPSDNYVIRNTINCTEFGVFTPISAFSGELDGADYPIIGLEIVDGPGLFASTNSAKLSNIRIVDVKVVSGLSSSKATGALVGTATDTEITSCSSKGFINHLQGGTGGLVGKAQSGTTIRESRSSVNVIACYDTGGLVGQLGEDAEIQGSFATGEVQHSDNCDTGDWPPWGVGGLVGYIYHGSILNSWASGNVTGATAVGGLVGSVWSTGLISEVTDSYSTGGIDGTNCSVFGSEGGCGGLFGNMGGLAYAQGCFSTGAVSGDCPTGVIDCPTGSIIGSMKIYGGNSPQVNDMYYYQHTTLDGIGLDETGTAQVTPINDISNFYNRTNPPLDTWNASVWCFYSGKEFPQLIWDPNKCPTIEEMLSELITLVEGLDDIPENVSKKATNIVTSVLKKLEDGNEANDVVAINKMEAFINFVTAKRGKNISDEEADLMITAAESVIETIQNG